MYDNCSVDVNNTSEHTCLRLDPVIKNKIGWNWKLIKKKKITIINYNTRIHLVKGRLKMKG